MAFRGSRSCDDRDGSGLHYEADILNSAQVMEKIKLGQRVR